MTLIGAKNTKNVLKLVLWIDGYSAYGMCVLRLLAMEDIFYRLGHFKKNTQGYKC